MLQRKQPSPPLARRINYQRRNEQPNSNANRRLDHTIAQTGQGCSRRTTRRIRRSIPDRIRVLNRRQDRAGRGQTRRHHGEDTGDGGAHRVAVPEATVQVRQQADGERADGIGDLRRGAQLLGAEIVGDVTRGPDQDHHGDLSEFGLVDQCRDDAVCRDEGEVRGVRAAPDALPGAGGVAGCVGVDGAVDGGADCDAVTQEEGVEDGVHETIDPAII